MTKLIDCFTFYNEVEILKFRLKYLNETVDNFVISEATKTHSGISRELIFPTIEHEIPQHIRDKIIYVEVNDMSSLPGHSNNWEREKLQRNRLIQGIDKIKLNSDDYIMISDIDEIPRKSALEEVKNKKCNGFHLNCLFFYFSIQSQIFTDENTPYIWGSPRGIRYEYFKQIGIEVNAIRNTAQYPCEFVTESIENGGWHFSYFGGYDRIKKKVESYAHQEFNDPNYIMNLSHVLSGLGMKTNIDVFNVNSIVKPADLSIFDKEIIEDKEFFEYIGGIL